jgi:hypothetical protein
MSFTALHVALSLVAIGSGVIVVFGLLTARRFDSWTAIFLTTSVLTSASGFGFPFHELLPSHVVGALSLLVLVVAIFARYGGHLSGGWRSIYVIAAVVALYFNVFVLVVQAFLKVPALNAVAPTQSEPPFVATQLVVLAGFLAIGVMSVLRFRKSAESAPTPGLADRT